MPLISKTPSRTRLIAVVATTLALGASVLTWAGPASAAPARTDSARHAAAKTALDKVLAAFGPHAQARTSGKVQPRRDVTVMLRDLSLALPDLSARERAVAAPYLARPSAGGGSAFCYGTVIKSDHFCVHYSLSGVNQTTQAQAQATSDTFEYVYQREVTQLHYRAPLDDGDGLLDVYIQQLGTENPSNNPSGGIYGYCKPTGFSPDGSTTAAFCAVDNDFVEFPSSPSDSLKVTAAHEFFHAIQFAYDATEASWFLEGTAVWMEDIVYPTINDYLQYLPDSQVARPLRSTDYTGGLSVYGAVTFWKYLSERFRNNDIIRQIWNAAASSNGNRTGIQAVGAALSARRTTFAAEFARYGVWNTLPPNTYGDRALWLRRVSPGFWAGGTLSKKTRDTKTLGVRINHMANAPLLLRVGATLPTRAKVKVTVDAPNTSRGSRATVQLRLRSGKVKIYTIPLNAKGNATRSYSFNRKYVKSAIVILTNASTGYNAQLFKVRAKVVY